jgi:4-aminobutyrate aminotransferase
MMQSAQEDFVRFKSEGDINISPHRVEWQAAALDDETRALLEEDARYFLHQSLSTPCLNALRACEGIYIEDLQGRRYMDFHGNNVHQVGFANPDVIAAIKAQLDELSFCTRRYTNRVAVDLAKKLAELAPGNLNKVLFCPGGTSAIGIALKLARAATGRHKTVSMWDSFHGASLDAISIGGEALFRHDIGPLLPGTEHVPPPDEYRCLWGCSERGGCDLKCANYIEYVLEKEGDVAAVIAEPVRSTPYIPRPEYWQTIRQACDRHGALLIFDEIPHALGRTGAMFTCENFDVVPDILVLGKGLGGGVFPLAAIVAREDLDVAPDRALGHYTHEKNPVACAAALATIEYIEAHNLAEHARELGRHAFTRMTEMMERHPLIGDVRGLGLLLGMELVKDRVTKERATDEAEAVMYCALSKGLSFKLTMGNILTLTPPLTITRDEMEQAIAVIEGCLDEVENRECVSAHNFREGNQRRIRHAEFPEFHGASHHRPHPF